MDYNRWARVLDSLLPGGAGDGKWDKNVPLFDLGLLKVN
jgi:hypothetical protein